MGNREGYISAAGNASLVEKNRQTVDSGARQRREVVEFALQFLGGEYKYGGTDPNKGVDCSGFTRYVMKYGASVEYFLILPQDRLPAERKFPKKRCSRET